jgi:hypothetical protein
MRLHARPDHPDYRPDLAQFLVRLNGVDVADCVAADEDAGTVEVMVCNVQGKPLTDAAGTIVTETKRGKVEIYRRAEATT